MFKNIGIDRLQDQKSMPSNSVDVDQLLNRKSFLRRLQHMFISFLRKGSYNVIKLKFIGKYDLMNNET